MRYLLIGLGVLMLLFAGVQYNDPDGLFWAIIYLIPAVFAAIAAFQPAALGGGIGRAALLGAIVAAVAAMVYYWPVTDQFWRVDIWWNTETAREGMGLMIVVAGAVGVVCRLAGEDTAYLRLCGHLRIDQWCLAQRRQVGAAGAEAGDAQLVDQRT